jgi:zona occludens toxin
MIYLYTGSNGSGKTLNCIKFICEKLNPPSKGNDFGDRPVFYYSPDNQPLGIKEAGILDWTELTKDQVLDWHNIIPDGAILFIDEFRNVWGWRSHKENTPPSVDLLSEHRSKGLDFVLTAQKPSSQFDPAIQGFIEEHRHLSGVKGLSKSRHYIYQEFCSNPMNPPKLQIDSMEKEVHKFDKNYFPFYRSASVHTKVQRLPVLKLIAFALFFPIVGFLGWTGYNSFASIGDSESVESSVNSSTSTNSSYQDDYYSDLEPRLDGLRFTAPRYDDLEVVAERPTVDACFWRIERDDCRCVTSQGTPAFVPHEFCMSVVEHGLFREHRPWLNDDEASGANAARLAHSTNTRSSSRSSSKPSQSSKPKGVDISQANPFKTQ